MRRIFRPLFALLVALTVAGSAAAAVVRVAAYDAGSLNPSGPTVCVGSIAVSMDDNPSDPKIRNYFKFDLSEVRAEGEVVEAFLRLEFPLGAFASKETLERLRLYEVESDPATFGYDFAGSTGTAHSFSWPVWHDLGDGVPYGARVYRLSDEGTITRIRLNEAALADINAALSSGGKFTIGGRLAWKTHAGYGASGDVAPDVIFSGTAAASECDDLSFGTPSGWSKRELVLVIEP